MTSSFSLRGQQDPCCSLQSKPPGVTSANAHGAFKRVGKGILVRHDLLFSKGLTQRGVGGTSGMQSVIVEHSRGFHESGKGILVNYNLFFSKDLFQLRVGLSPVIFLPGYCSPF